MNELWYREADRWRTELSPKPGTKWHLYDEDRSTSDRVVALCAASARGDIGAPRERAILETATKTKPGMMVPTPGRGATCANCLRKLLKAAGIR